MQTAEKIYSNRIYFNGGLLKQFADNDTRIC
jgi:hypothetical protein